MCPPPSLSKKGQEALATQDRKDLSIQTIENEGLHDQTLAAFGMQCGRVYALDFPSIRENTQVLPKIYRLVCLLQATDLWLGVFSFFDGVAVCGPTPCAFQSFCDVT